MARNTDYNDVVLKLSEEYLNRERSLEDEEILPSIEGLALFINVSRSTIYEWIKDVAKREFADIIEQVLEKQGQSLINNGLKGKYAPTIAKVLLSKHGYREGIEQTGKDGEKLMPSTLSEEDKTKLLGLLNK